MDIAITEMGLSISAVILVYLLIFLTLIIQVKIR